MEKERLSDRRQFFKETFVGVAKYAAELMPKEEEKKSDKKKKKIVYLRPPGAVEESEFISLCTRCDECIKACPHQCIGYAESDTGLGTPVIVARVSACRLCPGFPCITACKTGALKPVNSIRDVKMGTAIMDKRRCPDHDEEKCSACQQCYRQCPLKDEALYLDDEYRPFLRAEKCAGCGICENICQAVNPPGAISITPAQKLILTQ
ncbi:MAG: 4Fe-4S dicluster domain-containing protein [Deltaproteobacteria bacterium]